MSVCISGLKHPIGLHQPLTVIAGPCVIESEDLVMDIAGFLSELTQRLGLSFLFKASFDKANRTSCHSFRGLGLEKGLRILEKVKATYGLPVLTDVHEDTPLHEVKAVVDVLQTPAFLCRQTDFIQRVARAGLPMNIKKGQFLSPTEMKPIVEKARAVAPDHPIMVCERGFAFGYQNLVVDMRSLVIMRETGCPVIFDASHSVQQPGGLQHASGGQKEFIGILAKAAVAVGVAGLFMETHPNPERALSDGPNSLPLDQMSQLLSELQALDQVAKSAMRVIREDGKTADV